jgi:peptide chain release factor 1
MFDQAYLDKVRSRVHELETLMSDPSVSGQRKRFQEAMAEHRRQKLFQEKLEDVLALRRRLGEAEQMLAAEEDAELRAMAQQEIDSVRARLPAAEKEAAIALLPADPRDGRNVIMEIRAGTGGEEAALFAANLFRMYGRYAEIMGWRVSVLDTSLADKGGFKEIILTIEGADVYARLKFESGTHRVQRVPVTEANGRIHTSTATVAVLAEADEADEIEIKTEDLRVDVYRSSGAGGQHVNTTDSAVRITHLPTGIVVASQEERSQHKNRDKAMRVLKSRLLEAQRQAEFDRQTAERRSQIGSGDRSERIRTYNFPQNRLTDHRIETTWYNLDRMIEGEIQDVVKALADRDLDDRMQVQMAR